MVKRKRFSKNCIYICIYFYSIHYNFLCPIENKYYISIEKMYNKKKGTEISRKIYKDNIFHIYLKDKLKKTCNSQTWSEIVKSTLTINQNMLSTVRDYSYFNC